SGSTTASCPPASPRSAPPSPSPNRFLSGSAVDFPTATQTESGLPLRAEEFEGFGEGEADGFAHRGAPGGDPLPERRASLLGRGRVLHRRLALARVLQQRIDLAFERRRDVLVVIGGIGGVQEERV